MTADHGYKLNRSIRLVADEARTHQNRAAVAAGVALTTAIVNPVAGAIMTLPVVYESLRALEESSKK